MDFDGDEVYQLRIRDLATGTDLAERIERTYYGLAWAADSRSLLYVVTDAAYRPHEVWRHELGTAPDRDTLVYREDDERFELTVRATRSGAWLLIETASRDTTETLLIPAGDTGAAPFVVEPRRPGTEYYADHAGRPGRGRALPRHQRRGGRVPAGPGARHGAGRGRAELDGGHRAGRGHPAGALRRVRALPGGGAAARGPRPSCGWWTARPARSG